MKLRRVEVGSEGSTEEEISLSAVSNHQRPIEGRWWRRTHRRQPEAKAAHLVEGKSVDSKHKVTPRSSSSSSASSSTCSVEGMSAQVDFEPSETHPYSWK